MPRSQGRIIVSPTAPLDVLQAMLPLGQSQALSRKLASPRGEDGEASQSASPSPTPRRPQRLPGGHFAPDGPREAWGAEGGAPLSPQEQRGSARSGSASRGGTGRKPKSGGRTPVAPQMSVEWHATTLFGGERCTNPKAKRASATTFRRPTSSRATPHQRPIFVVGPDAQDPRMCVDINAPKRFSSFERTRYELSWRQANRGGNPDEGCRALPEPATIRNIGNAGRPGSVGSAFGGRPFAEGRSGTPVRPDSVASVGFRGSSGPSPVPGQRPTPPRPVSTTPVQRGGWSSPTPPPACFSGA